MSNLYAIKNETLSALGDAIRNKVFGTSELIEEHKRTLIQSSGVFHITPKAKAPKYKVIISNIIIGPNYKGSGLVLTIYNHNNNNNSAFVVYRRTFKGTEPFELPDEMEVTVQDFVVESFVGNSTDSFDVEIKVIPLDENGNEFKYTPLEMVDKVNGLETIPETALNVTGECSYKFSSTGWNWFINQLGDKITTNNITGAQYMFSTNISIESIPFEINLAKNTTMSNMFSDCQKLKALPQVNIPALSTHVSFTYMFNNCYCIRELPDWVGDFFENDYNLGTANSTFSPYNYLFNGCYSLRSFPDKVMKYLANPKMSGIYYGIGYSKPFLNCFCLDELLNIYCDSYSLTSNNFSSFFAKLSRVKNITFATNEDGTPVIRPWKNQMFDLTNYIGFTSIPKDIIAYNSGITADKEVKDDATYQALKNDPDWFSCDVNYSRYNHDSAVNTINSLPDCSATGTNTIRLKGASGALTDGGAINTLTEEEIAVAVAKGWTVTFA